MNRHLALPTMALALLTGLPACVCAQSRTSHPTSVQEMDAAFDLASAEEKLLLLRRLRELDAPLGAWTAVRAIKSRDPDLARSAVSTWAWLARTREFDKMHGYPLGYLPAVEAFRKGDGKLAVLIDDLLQNSGSRAESWALLNAAARINDEAVIPVLSQKLTGSHRAEAYLAAKALTRWWRTHTLAALVDATDKNSQAAYEQNAVSQAVAEIGPIVLPRLIELASQLSWESDRDKIVYLSASLARVRSSDSAETLVRVAESGNKTQAIGALRLVAFMRPRVVQKVSKGSYPELRSEAQRILQRFRLFD